MKINWSNAPNWASYAAMDENGLWHWYENKPKPGSDSLGLWISIMGKHKRIRFENQWKATLKKRKKSVHHRTQ